MLRAAVERLRNRTPGASYLTASATSNDATRRRRAQTTGHWPVPRSLAIGESIRKHYTGLDVGAVLLTHSRWEGRAISMGGWWRGEAGAGVVEWIIVTLILTVAFLAILQAVGGDLMDAFSAVRQWAMGVLGR
jgi:Flp pilus assembly pilin Flp